MIDIDEILKFKKINRLKEVYRLNSVQNRKESSAEHTFSALLLADYILDEIDLDIDKEKVKQLILYHDLVEIESGDTPLHPDMDITEEQQFKNEYKCAKKLMKDFPEKFGKKFYYLFDEFMKLESIESKVARAIDVIDAEIHEIDQKQDFKGWSRKFIEDSKLKYFEDLPDIREIFNHIMDFYTDNGYFDE